MEDMEKEQDRNLEGSTTEGDSPQADQQAAEAAELERTIAELKREKEALWDRLLRKHAELENYRKRVEKEKEELYHQGVMSLAKEMLQVVDACERALASFNLPAQRSACQGDDSNVEQMLESYRSGVELIYRKLQNILGRFGVTPINAEGAKFDPHFHEAVTRVESSEHEENQIVEELQRGYMYYDRLLRPAQVKVAVRPTPRDEKMDREAGAEDKQPADPQTPSPDNA